MALFNHATKEVTAKLVYYGPGLCGKTTNLRWIHENLAFKSKGKLVSLPIQTDRTLFFDFLPVELGTIRGIRTRIQIYTVPGQIFHESTRRVVLRNCDAIVFVADSQAAMLDANAQSLRSLRQNLLVNEIDPAIPCAIQYNKRDLPTALPLSVLNARLNPRNLPTFEAVAFKGIGVEETLRGIIHLLFQWLSHTYREEDAVVVAAVPHATLKTQPEEQPRPTAGPVPTANPAITTRRLSPPPATEPSATAPPTRTPLAHPTALSEPEIVLGEKPLPPPIRAGTKFKATKPAAPQPTVVAESEKPWPPVDPAPNGTGLRSDQWVYLLGGVQCGPIDVDTLIDLVLTSIPEDTKVWHPGLEDWVRANQIREITEEIPPPLPIQGARRDYIEEDMPDFNTLPVMLRTVLIADEDAAFRKYLAMPLAAQGFTIYEAADGSAAWQLAVQNRPWLILADISMPEVDGFEFCRRVRNHPLLARIPVLFISGSDKYRERYRALQIGADDFLSKNAPVRELLMRIQLLMTRYSDLSVSGERKPGTADVAGAFQGRIEVFGAPALLQMCARGRLTGIFTALAEDAANTATVMGFREGDIISASVGTITGAQGVYAFLAWEKGSFKFTPGDPGPGEPLARSVEHLLLEGCLLLDESRTDDPANAGIL
jgi:CheY-like chemotaxis protein/signal recognition particle receptor subunit beta